MEMNFTDNVRKIWDSLTDKDHSFYIITYVDRLLFYLDNNSNLTFDDLTFKMSDLESLILLIDPKHSRDLKILNKLKNVFSTYESYIDKLNYIVKKS